MKRIILTVLLLTFLLPLHAQKAGEIGSVADRFDEFDATLKSLEKTLGRANKLAEMDEFDKSLADFSTRWGLYYQAEANVIGGTKSLLDACTQLLAAKDDLTQKAAARRLGLQAKADFQAAERFMEEKDSVYRRMLKSARRFSQVQATGKQLKKVQTREKLLTAQLDQHYGAAQAAVAADASLDISPLEEKYLNLKNYSAMIQACQYKPFIERIKDWLLSFAAVAMLLMFANMVQGKIQAARQMKENMKKMQEQLHKNDDEIPTI